MAFWTHFTRGPPRCGVPGQPSKWMVTRVSNDVVFGYSESSQTKSPHAVGDEVEVSPIRVRAKLWELYFVGRTGN